MPQIAKAQPAGMMSGFHWAAISAWVAELKIFEVALMIMAMMNPTTLRTCS